MVATLSQGHMLRYLVLRQPLTEAARSIRVCVLRKRGVVDDCSKSHWQLGQDQLCSEGCDAVVVCCGAFVMGRMFGNNGAGFDSGKPQVQYSITSCMLCW